MRGKQRWYNLTDAITKEDFKMEVKIEGAMSQGSQRE